MCSVGGCESWRRSAQRFRLPDDPEVREMWATFIAKANEHRCAESSWTEIAVCCEHFTGDCFDNETGSVRLKPGAVPSVCVDSGPETVGSFGSEVHGDEIYQPKTRHDSAPCSEESSQNVLGSDKSLVHTGASCSTESSECIKDEPWLNSDLIKKKAALLKEKGKFLVNEKHLLPLFSRKCPSCEGKLKMHKVTCGVAVSFNQLCLQCDYIYEWKNQADSCASAAEDGHVTEISETEAEDSGGVSDVPEIVAVLDKDDYSEAISEEMGDPGEVDSDDDWIPENLNLDEVEEVFPVRMFRARPNESNKYIDYCDYLSLTPAHTQLCTDCGRFHDRRKPHTCEHKMKPYSCIICGKRCVTEVALNFHSRIHNESYEHPCKYCNAVFKLKADKSIHEQLHIGEEKPFKCPECPMAFAKSRERKIHLEDHRGKVDLKCRFCGLEFYRELSIKRHLLVHTGEKPFKCSVCQRCFNQASHLKSHMRMHTGERPYKCKHCDKQFNHNVSLKTHVQRFHTDLESKEEAQKEVQEENTDCEKEILQPNKPKSRCTGRPVGRPKGLGSEKHGAENGAQGQRSNGGKRKYKWRRKKQLTEDSEDELSESPASLDSEEEWCIKSPKKEAGSRKRMVKASGSEEKDPKSITLVENEQKS
uniref:Uncharacterized protein n=1 Tax=Nothobranchius rachovii TaxID=451742 RepID=A0A1A8P3L8_9TELE